MGKNLALSAAVIVWSYLLLTLVFGDRGLVAYTALSEYRQDLESHLQQLSAIQESLENDSRRLRTDPEQVRIEARRLGYVRSTEGIIRIPGRTDAPGAVDSPGEKLQPPSPWKGERALFRTVALTIGLLAFFLTGAYQEILGDMHNLFGVTDAVDLSLDDNGQARICHARKGQTMAEVLDDVNFDTQALIRHLSVKLRDSGLEEADRQSIMGSIQAALDGYTYLTHPPHSHSDTN